MSEERKLIDLLPANLVLALWVVIAGGLTAKILGTQYLTTAVIVWSGALVGGAALTCASRYYRNLLDFTNLHGLLTTVTSSYAFIYSKSESGFTGSPRAVFVLAILIAAFGVINLFNVAYVVLKAERLANKQ